MTRHHIAVSVGVALIGSALAALAVHVLGAPEWAPWLMLIVSFCAFQVATLIVVEAVTEEVPQPLVDEPTVLDSPAIERCRFAPQPHFQAEPGELFAHLDTPFPAADLTVVLPAPDGYRGSRRAGAR